MRDGHAPLVLVTGAGRGIGRAAVERFVAGGARVVALSRSQDELAELVVRCPPVLARVLDVSDPRAVAEEIDRITREQGPPDVLVNNAGVTIRRPFTEITVAEWRAVMRVNLDGAFYVAQQAARRMSAAGGVIINLASTNALVGYRDHAAYSASKAAVLEMTRCMAVDLAPAIRVNAVCPGFIDTPLLSYDEDVATRIPLGRLGRASEVAALIAFLASDDAAYITGQGFVIDGGETVGSVAARCDRAAPSGA